MSCCSFMHPVSVEIKHSHSWELTVSAQVSDDRCKAQLRSFFDVFLLVHLWSCFLWQKRRKMGSTCNETTCSFAIVGLFPGCVYEMHLTCLYKWGQDTYYISWFMSRLTVGVTKDLRLVTLTESWGNFSTATLLFYYRLICWFFFLNGSTNF